MRNLPLGFFLGLLAVVHSTPVNTATQIPDSLGDEVAREAMTDGFLVDHFFLPTLTTQPPKQFTTARAPEQPPSDSKDSNATEGSAAGDADDVAASASPRHYTATTSPHGRSSTSTTGSSSGPSTSLGAMTSDSGSGDGEAWESGTPGDKDDAGATVSPAPSSAVATDGGESSWDSATTVSAMISDSGSGDEEMSGSGMREDKDSTTTAQSVTVAQSSSSATNAEDSSSGSTTAISAVVTGDEEISGFGLENEYHTENPGSDSTTTMSTLSPDPKSENERKVQEPTDGVQLNKASSQSLLNGPQGRVERPNLEPDQHKGHSTPGWIIIVGFVVGVAILVTLCIAIATRDKWNRPRQASQPETKTNSSNQQRELEMETFIHKDEPRENGKTAEYTVISLDELPENYSSH